MEIFLDSCDIENIERFKDKFPYALNGITTNPSLIAKSGRPCKDVIRDILKIAGNVPVSMQVTEINDIDMITQGLEYSAISNNIVVKLPCTDMGLRACRELSNVTVRTNITLCFSVIQAIMAAKAGATYVSPFIGRIDDTGNDGVYLIKDIKEAFDNYEIKTKILAASIRSIPHMSKCMKIGAHVATIPIGVADLLLENSLTKIGLEKFMFDFQNS